MLLGEHNHTGKSNIHPDDQRVWPLYRELAHIPLLMAAPGAAGGSRVVQLTQSVDLLPTFLDLSGVDYQGPHLHGHALTPLLQARGREWPRRFAFSSTFIRNGAPTITDRNWTYVPQGEKAGRAELYQMRSDPGQRKNLVRRHPRVAARMERALREFLLWVGTPEENRSLLDPVAGPDWAEKK